MEGIEKGVMYDIRCVCGDVDRSEKRTEGRTSVLLM